MLFANIQILAILFLKVSAAIVPTDHAKDAITLARRQTTTTDPTASLLLDVANDALKSGFRAARRAWNPNVDSSVVLNTFLCPLLGEVSDMVDSSLERTNSNALTDRTIGKLNEFLGVAEGMINAVTPHNVACSGVNDLREAQSTARNRLSANSGSDSAIIDPQRRKRSQKNSAVKVVGGLISRATIGDLLTSSVLAEGMGDLSATLNTGASQLDTAGSDRSELLEEAICPLTLIQASTAAKIRELLGSDSITDASLRSQLQAAVDMSNRYTTLEGSASTSCTGLQGFKDSIAALNSQLSTDSSQSSFQSSSISPYTTSSTSPEPSSLQSASSSSQSTIRVEQSSNLSGLTTPSSPPSGSLPSTSASASTSGADPGYSSDDSFSLFFFSIEAMNGLFTASGKAFGASRVNGVDGQVLGNTILCPVAKTIAGATQQGLSAWGSNPLNGRMRGLMNEFVGKVDGYLGMTCCGRVSCDMSELAQAQTAVLAKLRDSQVQKRQISENLEGMTDTAALAVDSAAATIAPVPLAASGSGLSGGSTINNETLTAIMSAVGDLSAAIGNSTPTVPLTEAGICPLMGNLASALYDATTMAGPSTTWSPENSILYATYGQTNMALGVASSNSMTCPEVGQLTSSRDLLAERLNATASSTNIVIKTSPTSTSVTSSESSTSSTSTAADSTRSSTSASLYMSTVSDTTNAVSSGTMASSISSISETSSGRASETSTTTSVSSASTSTPSPTLPDGQEETIPPPERDANPAIDEVGETSGTPSRVVRTRTVTTVYRTVRLPAKVPTNLPPGVYPVGASRPGPIFITRTHPATITRSYQAPSVARRNFRIGAASVQF